MSRAIYSLIISVVTLSYIIKCETNAKIPDVKMLMPMDKFIVARMQELFKSKTSVVWITQKSSDRNHKLYQLEILNDIMYESQGNMSFQFDTNNGLGQIPVTNRPRFCFMIIDNDKSFKKLLARQRIKELDVTGYYLLFITQNIAEDSHPIMERIFKLAWMSYITNINTVFINRPNNEPLIMYTYFPYSSQKCGDTTPVQLNAKDLISYQGMFPLKTRNLYSCPLYVATFDTPPFIMMESSRNRVGGIEGKLLGTLAKRLNFRVNIKNPEDNQNWGEIFENGTSTGVIKWVGDGIVNLTIGSWGLTKKRLDTMDATLSYLQSHLVLAIAPGTPYSSYQKLFLPFENHVWFMIGIQFVFSILLVLGLKFVAAPKRNFIIGRRNTVPLLSVSGIFLGGPMSYVPRRNFARTLAMIWMLGCLVIRSSYQGSLFSSLQLVKHFTTADTIDKMIQLNFKFYVTEGGRDYLKLIPNISEHIVDIDVMTRNNYWDRIQSTKFKGALLTSRSEIKYKNYLQWKTNPNDQAIYMYPIGKEDIRLLSIIMYVSRGSCLTAQFNQEISRYLSSGLICHWLNSFYDVSRSVRRGPALQQPTAMNLNHVAGSFYLCLVLLLISFVVFILEVLSKWVGWIRVTMDFLT